jgi:hypothetical protein
MDPLASRMASPDEVLRAEVLLVSLLSGLGLRDVQSGHTIALQVRSLWHASCYVRAMLH